MTEIKVEKPSEEKLKELGTDKWSLWECEPSTLFFIEFPNGKVFILLAKIQKCTV